MQNKSKVLIFIDWYLPGYKAGGPIQSVANIVRILSKVYDLYIVTMNIDYMSEEPYMEISPNRWIQRDGVKVFYFEQSTISFSGIKKSIDHVEPDIIYCNSLYSWHFTICPIFIARCKGISNVLAVRGMLSDGSLSIKKRKKQVFLFLMKCLSFFSKTRFHATYDVERQDVIKKLNILPKEVLIARNVSSKSEKFIEKGKNSGEINIVFISRIAKEKNLKYALELLKEVKSNVVYDIYGPIYDQSYWSECERVISELPINIKATYQGVLPHKNLHIVLSKAHVFLLPTMGENFGHAIIEAMNYSCIPVISNNTPWKELQKEEVGYAIDLSDKKKFIQAIEKIASLDKMAIRQYAKNANIYARNVIEDDEIFLSYKRLFSFN